MSTRFQDRDPNTPITAEFLNQVDDLVVGLPLDTGAALVGADDDAGGSLYTTVAGFIAHLLSSAGSSIIGYLQDGIGAVMRTLQDKGRDVINVKDFGAKLDNATDDLAALNKAIAHIRTLGGGTLDFGSSGLNNCRISAPLRLCGNLRLTGNARILPTVGFSSAGVVFPTYITEVPQTYSCLAYFNDGTHADDPNNFGYANLRIDDTVTFDGQYHVQAANGIIVEGMTSYKIDAAFTQFLSLGVWMKYYCWGGAVRGYLTSCRTAMLKLGAAANGIDLNGLRVYGLADTPTYGIIIDGDNNGVNLSGAFVEKCVNQILWVGGSGPATISGVDFEICSGTAIHVDGTGTAGRAAGPVTITGCFLEATVNTVKATNAIVIVQGCRIRATALAFETVGAASRIYDVGNVIEASVTVRSSGNVISDTVIPFTPAWSAGGAITVGDGSVLGAYSTQGERVTINATLNVGGTTIFPGGNLSLTLPITSSQAGLQYLGTWRIFDSSASTFTYGHVEIDGTGSTASLQVSGGLNATDLLPVPLASGDQLSLQITYFR